MPVTALLASHTPLMDIVEPSGQAGERFRACFGRLRERVRAFDPELVIVFGPDHYNGFFYRLMPPFCIGLDAESVGDWSTPAGRLPVPTALAESLVRHVQSAGVDVSYSYRMDADHGATQAPMMLFDWSRLPPLIPIFVNAAAPPLPPWHRVAALGRAVGTWAGALGTRVLIVASGGLSHDPPIPQLATASPPLRERIIEGGRLTREARAKREQRVKDEATAQVNRTSTAVPLNPAWDREVMQRIAAADFAWLEAQDDDVVSRTTGCGGHEVRTWLAAAAAKQAAGGYDAQVHFYEPITEWITGVGIMTIE